MVSSDHPTRSELIDRRLFLHQLSTFPFKTKTEPITPYDYGKKSGRQEEREKGTGEDAQREKRRKTREESQERLTKESTRPVATDRATFFGRLYEYAHNVSAACLFWLFPKAQPHQKPVDRWVGLSGDACFLFAREAAPRSGWAMTGAAFPDRTGACRCPVSVPPGGTTAQVCAWSQSGPRKPKRTG